MPKTFNENQTGGRIMTFGHGDTKILERIATALEKQAELLESQNLMLDTIVGELENIQGEDYSLESITNAIYSIKGDDYSLESITRAIQNIRR